MKSGWQSSEFWITVGGQLLALLAVLGAVNVGDKDKLETALTNAVTAIFTIISSAAVVSRYIRSRSALKSQAMMPVTASRGVGVVALLLTVAGLFAAAPVRAEPPVEKTCFIFIHRGQRPPRQDPAVAAALQQLAQNQQTIIGLLQQQHAQPAPQIIVLAPPAQQIPLGGAPRQDVPLGGQPRQDVPLGPTPRQTIPLGEPKPFVPPVGEGKPTGLQQYVPAVARR